MPAYDVINGLASVGPVGFLISVGLVVLIGYAITRKK